MTARDTVKALAPSVNAYFNAVMVFTSAWLDVKFGSTGSVFCVREDDVFDYIFEHKTGARLGQAEVELIARAEHLFATAGGLSVSTN